MENQETYNTDNNSSEETTDYKSLYEQAQKDLEKVVAKKEELLNETKKAKQDRATQLAAAQKAEMEKAQKDGEYEKLWQTAEEQRKSLETALQTERNAYRQEKIQTNAMKLAVELADGDAQSAKLLSYFIQEKLNKMANENGNLDDTAVEAVKLEFKNNRDYAPLLSGSKANGGGALGSGNRVTQSNSIDRASFNKMNPIQQHNFVTKQKGIVVD